MHNEQASRRLKPWSTVSELNEAAKITDKQSSDSKAAGPENNRSGDRGEDEIARLERARMREASADDLIEQELTEQKKLDEETLQVQKMPPDEKKRHDLAKRLGVGNKESANKISAAKARIADIRELRAWPDKIKDELIKLLDQTTLSADARVVILSSKKFLNDLIKRGFTPESRQTLDEALRDQVALSQKGLETAYGVKFDSHGEPVVGLWGKLTGKMGRIKENELYQDFKAFFDFRQAAKRSVTNRRKLGKAALGLGLAAGVAGVIANEYGQDDKPTKITDTTEEPRRERTAKTELPDDESYPKWQSEQDNKISKDETTEGEEYGPSKKALPNLEPFRPRTEATEPRPVTSPTATTATSQESDSTPRVAAEKRETPAGLIRKAKAPRPKLRTLGLPDEAGRLDTQKRGAATAKPGQSLDLEDTRRSRLKPWHTPEEEAALEEANAMRRAVSDSVKRVREIPIRGKGNVKVELSVAPHIEKAMAETSRLAHEGEVDTDDDENEDTDSQAARDTKSSQEQANRELRDATAHLTKSLHQKYFTESGSYSTRQLRLWEQTLGNLLRKQLENAPSGQRSELASRLNKLLDQPHGAPGSLDRLFGLAQNLTRELGPSQTLTTFEESLLTSEK